MFYTAKSVFQPEPFTIEHKGNKTDVYMRQNIHEVTEIIEEVECTQFEYDEAFATFEGLAGPTAEMIIDDFDGWFSIVSAWLADGGTSNEQLRADIDFISVMADIPLN